MHAYEKVRAEMLRRISSQDWPQGMTLPHEEVLAEEFGVARGTMRRAMADLTERGLIERKRRAGTKVAARNAHSSTLTIPIVRTEITKSGAQYGYKLLEKVIGGAKLDLAGHFGGASLLKILCLHLADGRPYQLEDRLISLDAVPHAETADFSAMSPNEWLVEKVPYSAVRTMLSADSANEEQAQHLKLDVNSPVFVIERQTRLDQLAVTQVKMTHPAASFSITTETSLFK
jgi:GntR family histidine utilization transcriptional repressor